MLYSTSTVAAGGDVGNRRGRGVEAGGEVDWHYSFVITNKVKNRTKPTVPGTELSLVVP